MKSHTDLQQSEAKQLLLQDLCARLPFGVKTRYSVNGYLMTINSIDVSSETVDIIGEGHRFTGVPVDEIKPFLRRMSSMTDEEKIEFDRLMNLVEERCINAYGKGGYSLAFIELDKWLNAHYFDYCGFIDSGVANEAQEGMYN